MQSFRNQHRTLRTSAAHSQTLFIRHTVFLRRTFNYIKCSTSLVGCVGEASTKSPNHAEGQGAPMSERVDRRDRVCVFRRKSTPNVIQMFSMYSLYKEVAMKLFFVHCITGWS